MQETTRVLAVLGAITLVMAPMVNGILADAAKTADRLVFKDADWDSDPPLPEDYDGPPPEDPPEGDQDQNLTGPAGGQPTCTIQEEPTEAVWHHEDPASNTGSLTTRTLDSSTKAFTVEDRHVGLGVRFEYEDLRGRLRASVHPEGSPEDAVFSEDTGMVLGNSDSETTTATRPALTSGDWVAELDFREASYSKLTLVVVLASCVGSSADQPSGEGSR